MSSGGPVLSGWLAAFATGSSGGMVEPDRIKQLQCSATDSGQARHLVRARLCSPVLAHARPGEERGVGRDGLPMQHHECMWWGGVQSEQTRHGNVVI
jgi:hypothetical protein